MNSLKSFSIPCLRSKKELDELVRKARTGKDPNDSVVRPPIAPPSNPVTSSSVVHVLSLDSTPVIQDSRFREQLCSKPPDPAPSFESVLLLNTSPLNQPIRNSRKKSPSVPPLTIKRIVKNDGSYNYQVSNHMLPFMTHQTLQIPRSNVAVNLIDSNVHTYSIESGRPSSAGGSNGPAVSLEWINDDPCPIESHSIVTVINEADHRQEGEQLSFVNSRKRQNGDDPAFDQLSKKKKSYKRSISSVYSRKIEEKKLMEKQTLISTQGMPKQKGCDNVAMATRTSFPNQNNKGTSSDMVRMLAKEPTILLPSIKNRPLLKTRSTENITVAENHTHNTVDPVNLTRTNDHAHNNNHHYGNNKGVSLRSHTHKTSNRKDSSHTHNPVCIDDHAHNSANINKDNSTKNDHTHDLLSHTHNFGNDNIVYIQDTSEDNSDIESVITINIDSPIIIVDESDIDTPPSSLSPPTDDGIPTRTCNGLTDLFKRKANSVALNSPVCTDRNVYHAVLLEWQVCLNRNLNTDASIIVENTVDLTPPPLTFNYISENIYSKGVPRPDPMAVVGCSCTECSESSNCCPHMAGHKFAYYRNGKLKIGAKTPIYECNSMCSCDENCSNRVVQKGSQYSFCIFRTHNGRGWGAKTCCPIEKGRFVMEYVGEVITFEEAERRGKQYDKEGATYLFDLDYDSIDFTIDATLNGNVSHFLNHSCDPNLVVFSVWIDTLDLRLPRLALFARRDIDIGEELTFDYQMNHNMMSVDPDKRTPCLCGTKKCRKYLF